MSRTTEAVNRIPPQVSIGTLALLCACFVLSGVAALIYQTAWTRQFAIVFGTSELAVATVLAAYMGGLALGAVLAERFLPRVTRPVLTYALLELGIAASAIFVVPALLWLANVALQAMFGGQPSPPDSDHAGTTLFYLVSAFVALALPTTLMGATLPMLARYAVAEEAQIGRRIGLLYAMNTAGAVAGALLTAFVLLPELGLTRTIWVAAALNAHRVPAGRRAGAAHALREAGQGIFGRRAAAASSAGAHPQALLQGVSGTGLGVATDAAGGRRRLLPGSAVDPHAVARRRQQHLRVRRHGRELPHRHRAGRRARRRCARRRASARRWRSAVALIVAAVAAAVAYLRLESLLPAHRRPAGERQTCHFGFLHVPNALFCGLLLLPMTIAIGMTYPLAVRVLAQRRRRTPRRRAPASTPGTPWARSSGRWPRDSC